MLNHRFQNIEASFGSEKSGNVEEWRRVVE